MVNGTLLNFGKRYKDNLKVIFDQWPELHLGLDALSNQKTLNGIYYILTRSNTYPQNHLSNNNSLYYCFVNSVFTKKYQFNIDIWL